jgi:ATP-dependent RNA helicase DDX56/DBP9
MPPNPAGYIHRIGRTGRANKTGASISLVSSDFAWFSSVKQIIIVRHGHMLGDRVYSVIYFLLCWYLYFQVSPDEDDVFEEIENMLQDVENKDTKCILPFPLLTQNAVESLRYRAQVWDE